MAQKTAVITGVAGFIGSNLAEKLLEEGYDVKAIDNFDPYYSKEIKKENIKQIEAKSRTSEGEFNLVRGSINKVSDLEKLPKSPEKVFHLAARPGTRSSIGKASEYERINVKGTSKVLNYFKPTKKMVHMSSSSIYGEKNLEELPVKESHAKKPDNPYAKSKLDAEYLVKQKNYKKCDTTILRPFTVFGPRQRPDEVFTKFISDILSQNPIEVYGDGSQSRDFTFVEDVVQGTLLASNHGSGVYNLGKGKRNTVQEIIDLIDEELDYPVRTKYGSRREGDVTHTHANIDKAREELGFDPKTSLRDPVGTTINWVKDMKSNGFL